MIVVRWTVDGGNYLNLSESIDVPLEYRNMSDLNVIIIRNYLNEVLSRICYLAEVS